MPRMSPKPRKAQTKDDLRNLKRDAEVDLSTSSSSFGISEIPFQEKFLMINQLLRSLRLSSRGEGGGLCRL